MKKIYKVFTVLLFTGAITSAVAQDCKNALPFTEGAEFEMKSYNEKDKLQSSARHKVLSKKESGSTIEAEVKSEAYDEKNKLIGSNAYTVKCDNGVFMVDMKTMLNPEQMKGFEGMDVKVEADYLEMPAALTPGTALKDGKVVMTINGPIPMTNTINITNRKVAGTETITTPAGTFECVKITYDIETKFGFKVNTKAEEWYSKDVGTVLSKTYNSKGKLQGYTQLTSMKK